jgi:hypothetical protein
MIEVPMCVDEVGDGVGAEAGKRLGELRPRHADAGIDQNFAVRAGQDRDVSAGAFEHAYIVAQSVRDDRRHRSTVLDETDESARFRECLARREPSACGRQSAAAHATEAKPASRQ